MTARMGTRPGQGLLAGLAAAAILAATTQAGAAIKPQYQRAEELKAILDSDVVAKLGRPIDRIERQGPDLYRIEAGTCAIEARIVDDPKAADVEGPRQVLVQSGDAACR